MRTFFKSAIGNFFPEIEKKSHLDSIGKGAEYWPLRTPKKIPEYTFMLKKIEKISLICLLTWLYNKPSVARTTPVLNKSSSPKGVQAIEVRLYLVIHDFEPQALPYFQMWIFDLPDGGGRLLRERSGHSAPPNRLRHYGTNGQNILSAGTGKGDSRLFIYRPILMCTDQPAHLSDLIEAVHWSAS